MHQQVVLGQEAGEQHPVPLLVGDLVGQEGQRVGFRVIAQLAGHRAQAAAQLALRLVHGRERLGAGDGQRGQRGARRLLRGPAGGDDGVFEGFAEVGG